MGPEDCREKRGDDDARRTVQDIGEEEDARLGVGEEVYRKHDGVFFQLRSDQRRRDVRSAGEVLRFESTGVYAVGDVVSTDGVRESGVRVRVSDTHDDVFAGVFKRRGDEERTAVYYFRGGVVSHDGIHRGALRRHRARVYETRAVYHRTRPRRAGEIHEKVHRVDGGDVSARARERVGVDVRDVKRSVRAILDRIERAHSHRRVSVFREGKRVSELPGHVVANIADDWPRTGWTGALERDLNLGGRRSKSIPDRVAVASHVYFTRFERFVRV